MHKYTKQFTNHNCPIDDIVASGTIYHTQKTIFIMLRPTADGLRFALHSGSRAEDRLTPA